MKENQLILEIQNTYPGIMLDILDTIQEVILIIDKQSRIIHVNAAYCNTHKVNRKKMVGRFLSSIEPTARILDVLKTQETISSEASHIFSLNIDVIADMAPLYSNGELIGAVASFKDVTEVSNMNRELEHFKNLSSYLQRELSKQSELPSTFNRIIGQNSSFMNVLRVAAKVAKTDASVLIRGESGVGKEGLADALHYSSMRASGPFIKINCAAIPETLLESELFGYEQGAFTGASTGGRVGKFELANKGTLFLDEIGDMSLAMQAKVLRAIQEKEIERVGGNHKKKIDIRLIAATNRDLEEMIQNRLFREDLFYRLNVISLVIPPLRERKNDIPILANVFLEEMRNLYHKELTFSPSVIELLSEYHWAGNIRQLKNIIEQVSIICQGGMIQPEHLPQSLLRQTQREANQGQPSTHLKQLIEAVEQEAILAALRASGNNKSRAIDSLGISRRAFYQKLQKYNINERLFQ